MQDAKNKCKPIPYPYFLRSPANHHQCQANEICKNCIISVAEDVALGERICFRCTLVELRFDSGGMLPYPIIDCTH
jgi:hypothetical protein